MSRMAQRSAYNRHFLYTFGDDSAGDVTGQGGLDVFELPRRDANRHFIGGKGCDDDHLVEQRHWALGATAQYHFILPAPRSRAKPSP